MKQNFFAVDLGATSGRTILGSFIEGGLNLEEINRFPNHLIEVGGHFYWDIYALYRHIIDGLKLVAHRGESIASIGIDTWGVDFVLLGKDGNLLRQPYAYRDPHTVGAPEAFFSRISRSEVYGKTGIQVMNFNSLFQLDTLRRNHDSALEAADKVLFMPDALSYMLTGKMVTEYTIASTAQLVNAHTQRLEPELLKAVGLQEENFGRFVFPGEKIGTLTEEVQKITGLGAIPVIAVAGHDTGSAVAAVPALDRNFAYLSSGTWSLMGIESEKPIVTDEAYRMNFTNEGGIDGTTRFLKNITGLWLLEQCLKVWKNKSGVTYSYPQIVEMAQSVATNESYVDPDDATFSNPVSMPEAIADYCKSHHMAVPRTHAEYVRCIFESLALKYRFVLTRLQTVASFPIECLHIIGGGSQNDLLNRFTANAIGLPVIAGPSEATALGNVLVQLRALGVVADRDSMRRLAAGAVSLQRYEPCDTELWNEKYVIFKKKCNLL